MTTPPADELDDGVDPTLGLVRTMSMSTDKSILKELRDAMNPKEKEQTLVLMAQAGVALVVVIALCAVAVEGTIKLREVRVGVQDMATETTELKVMTQAVDKEMNVLVKTLEPVLVLPSMAETVANLSEKMYTLTEINCGSSLFAPYCPVEDRGPLLQPGTPAGDIVESESQTVPTGYAATHSNSTTNSTTEAEEGQETAPDDIG